MRIFFYIEIYHCTLIPMTTSSSRQSKKDTKPESLIDQSANLEDVAVEDVPLEEVIAELFRESSQKSDSGEE